MFTEIKNFAMVSECPNVGLRNPYSWPQICLKTGHGQDKVYLAASIRKWGPDLSATQINVYNFDNVQDTILEPVHLFN